MRTDFYKTGVEIDWDTADRIAVAAIREYCSNLMEQNESLVEQMKNGTATPGRAEDYAHNVRYLEAARIVLKDFGEEL